MGVILHGGHSCSCHVWQLTSRPPNTSGGPEDSVGGGTGDQDEWDMTPSPAMRVAKPQILNKEPAGLLTLNQRSPSHDSDPDPEVFGPVVDQTGDEWGVLAAKTTRQQKKKTPESSGPATRKSIRTAEMMLSSAQSLPRNSAKTSSLHGMMFSCTRNT